MKGGALQILSLILALALWQLVSTAVSTVIPAPTDVLPAFYQLVVTGAFAEHLAVSFRRVLFGFACAYVVGATYGIASSRIPSVRSLFAPLVTVVMSTTSLVIIFSLMLMLGQTETTIIVIVTIIVFGFVGTPIRDTLDAIDGDLLTMLASYKVGWPSRISDVYVPYLVPAILATTRIGFNYSWKIVVLCEVFGFSAGIGRQISLNYYQYDLTRLLAWLTVFLVVVLLVEQLLRPVERQAAGWRTIVAVS
jgi:ABC-type nitrate/sulfonate/bicarbonate transport system permease component